MAADEASDTTFGQWLLFVLADVYRLRVV